MKILSIVDPLHVTFDLGDDEALDRICSLSNKDYNSFWDEVSEVFLSKANVQLIDWSNFKDNHSFSIDIFFAENKSAKEQVKLIEKYIALMFLTA